MMPGTAVDFPDPVGAVRSTRERVLPDVAARRSAAISWMGSLILRSGTASAHESSGCGVVAGPAASGAGGGVTISTGASFGA